VLAALDWTRLELSRAADRALDRFVMANVKLKSFLELVLQRLFDTDGLGRTLRKYPQALQALLDLGQIEPQPP
jgi:predicted component of type VI protein secretion system